MYVHRIYYVDYSIVYITVGTCTEETVTTIKQATGSLTPTTSG